MPKSPNFPGLADRSIARLACPCFSAANLCGTKVSHALSSISVHAMKISDFATVVRSFNCDFVERCRFRTQQEATYLEKRLRIRPLGVVSKNDMGLRKIAYAILSCSFRDAYDDSRSQPLVLPLRRHPCINDSRCADVQRVIAGATCT